MNISFNTIRNVYLPQFKALPQPIQNNPQQQVSNDTFVHTQKSKDCYMKQLECLFPNGQLDKFYDNMNKSLGIDIPAKISFVSTMDNIRAGGYSFYTNEISLALEDLLDSDTKIVGYKNGKRYPLVSPKEHLPLFVNKNLADMFIYQHSKANNLGFDKLVAEPITDNERRKFIYQKILHEVIHAQQHMILRQTQGIGTKEVLKAWTHFIPKNESEKQQLEQYAQTNYEKTPWKSNPDKTKYPANSQVGQLARIWLEAIRKYPPVDSPEYSKNAIEVDAYTRSAQMADKIFGSWNQLVGN